MCKDAGDEDDITEEGDWRVFLMDIGAIPLGYMQLVTVFRQHLHGVSEELFNHKSKDTFFGKILCVLFYCIFEAL